MSPVVISNPCDPYWNQAVESHLLERAANRPAILFLWRSRPAVVIGKNQNPWRECHLEAIQRDGVHLARRVSGGGAVYHDEGNLNYSIIVDRAGYEEKKQFDVIRRALRELGMDVNVQNRTSLMADGRKVSGNAFCFRKQSVLHHGTILVDSDLDRLSEYLIPGPYAIRTHAIESVPADVMNLRERNPRLEIADVCRAVEEAFVRHYDGRHEILKAEDLPESADLQSAARHYASPEWIYGYTPGFDMRVRREKEGRTVGLDLRIEKGCIKRGSLDGLSGKEEDAVLEVLIGRPLYALELDRALEHVREPGSRDFLEWIQALPL